MYIIYWNMISPQIMVIILFSHWEYMWLQLTSMHVGIQLYRNSYSLTYKHLHHKWCILLQKFSLIFCIQLFAITALILQFVLHLPTSASIQETFLQKFLEISKVIVSLHLTWIAILVVLYFQRELVKIWKVYTFCQIKYYVF